MMFSNMKKELLCSVIILTYKQLEYLPETIRMVTEQTYPNIEMIITDDGTPGFDTENIKKLCDKFCCYKNIKYKIIHAERNQGTVKNFNRGIKASKGELIIPMAGDNSFYSRSSIEKIVNSYKEKKWLVATGKQILSEGNKILEIRPYRNEIALLKYADERYLALRLAMFPCFIAGAATVYSREAFRKYGLFDEKYILLEDCPFYIKMLLQGEKIEFINELLINHSVDRKSRRNKLLIKDDIQVVDWLIEDRNKISRLQKHQLSFRKKLLMAEYGGHERYKVRDIAGVFFYILYKIYTKFFRLISKIELKIKGIG